MEQKGRGKDEKERKWEGFDGEIDGNSTNMARRISVFFVHIKCNLSMLCAHIIEDKLKEMNGPENNNNGNGMI